MFGLFTAIFSAVLSSMQAKKQRKAAKKVAQENARLAREDASKLRAAEVFSQTEGKGVGEQGKISLSLSNKIDPEEQKLRKGVSNVRI